MQVVAIMMVRDEDDVLAFTLEHLLAEQVDRIVVADNLSVDGTHEILEDYATVFPVTIVDDPVLRYSQSAKMTALAGSHCAEGSSRIAYALTTDLPGPRGTPRPRSACGRG